MKNIFLIIIVLIMMITNIFGQVVYSEPQFPTENDSIIIYFDATKADRTDLVGYTGDLYTHTGVNTDIGNWQHVIESWGNNNTQPKLTRIGNDLYKLVVGYPRDFYDITNDNEHISTLNFVFRSADAAKQSEDVFFQIYETGFSIVVTNPIIDMTYDDPLNSPYFADPGDTVQITIATTSEADSLKLFQDDTPLLTTMSESELSYNYICSEQSGIINFKVIGYSDIKIDSTEFMIFINPEINEEPIPANTIPGINYIDNTTVILSLYAPFKENIYVIGDFTDWKVKENYQMNRHTVTEDSVTYWLQIENLSPGTEYAFQYLIDGNLRVADPYTQKTLNPWNDKYISSSTYPNLKSYPYGKTNEPVAIIQTGQTDFNWTTLDYQRPENEKLVIYELHIRDFIENHDYKTLIDTLDYLDNLGVTAIELMPINEFEGNSSWGYNPAFYFATDKYYGPTNDLKRFIDECHSRGIAVILDMVLNHSYGQSPLVRMYWNNSENRPSSDNPWFNEISPNQQFSWGYDYNHESKHTQYFVDRVNKFWMDEFKFDGFRFDFTKGFTNTSGNPGYDTKRINLLKRMADKIWETDSSAYIILEHWADNAEEKILSNYKQGMMLWGNSTHNYGEAAMGWNSSGKSDFSWGFYKNRGWTKPHLITYMESHDEERLMYKNLNWGNATAGYNTKEMATAINRMKLVAAFFLTQPGPKMIWQFGELGYDYSIDYNGRVGEKPIKWEYYHDEVRQNLYKTYAALLKLRNENDVFTNAGTSVSLSVGSTAKRIMLSGSMNVIVVGNFGVTPLTMDASFQHGGVWYDYFLGDTLHITSNTNVTLNAGEFHIFTDRKVESPEVGIITDIKEEIVKLPKEFKIHNAYPNPFNPSTTISFELPKKSDVKLSIYNIQGKEVWTQSQSPLRMNAGTCEVKWNGVDNHDQILSTGVYFVKISTSEYSGMQKVMFIK